MHPKHTVIHRSNSSRADYLSLLLRRSVVNGSCWIVWCNIRARRPALLVIAVLTLRSCSKSSSSLYHCVGGEGKETDQCGRASVSYLKWQSHKEISVSSRDWAALPTLNPLICTGECKGDPPPISTTQPIQICCNQTVFGPLPAFPRKLPNISPDLTHDFLWLCLNCASFPNYRINREVGLTTLTRSKSTSALLSFSQL